MTIDEIIDDWTGEEEVLKSIVQAYIAGLRDANGNYDSEEDDQPSDDGFFEELEAKLNEEPEWQRDSGDECVCEHCRALRRDTIDWDDLRARRLNNNNY